MRCSPSTACLRRSLLGLGGRGGQRAGCVDVRAGRGAAEDTSSDAAVHGYF